MDNPPGVDNYYKDHSLDLSSGPAGARQIALILYYMLSMVYVRISFIGDSE